MRNSILEDRFEEFYNEHLENIYAQLIDNIMAKEPGFFENLIVDLLLKMGYGYDKNSGIVVGGSHDNGIDGIINEDKLIISIPTNTIMEGAFNDECKSR